MKKKALFLDRDGTLIVEPPEDLQVDSLEKLEFIPGVFRNLYRITRAFDYELIMVSNQDGLGTEQYPREKYEKVQEKMITAFRNEGVTFDAIHIDPTLPEEKAPTRKPGTAMLEKYMDGRYDLQSSLVLGDRLTDIILARNLGSRAIWFADPEREEELKEAGLEEYCTLISDNWDRIYDFLLAEQSRVRVERKTGETSVLVEMQLYGSGKGQMQTGLGFLDHMLAQIAKHSGINLRVDVSGDLHVDEHHTIEDTALVLGESLNKALGKKKGISRYGFVLPMDDALAQVAIDLGGRPWLEWKVELKREYIGDVPTEMFMHFFKSLSDTAKCNLNIKAEGTNEHHKIEAVFKAFARALKQAISLEEGQGLPSTKGKL